MKFKHIVVAVSLIMLPFSIFFLSNTVSAQQVNDLKIVKNQAISIPRQNITVSSYITSKKITFNNRFISNPETKVAATISFKNWASINEAVELLDGKNIEPLSLMYAFRGKDFGHGEMYISPNMDIINTWNNVLQTRLDHFEAEKNHSGSFTDSPNASANSEKLREQAVKKIEQINAKTPIIYSIRVKATLNDLKLLESNNNIRLIDIVDEHSLQVLSSQGIDETNTVLQGIIPDDVDNFNFTFEPQEI